MDSQQNFLHLLDLLGYATSPNLIARGIADNTISPELEKTWREASNKLQIDAIYFIASTPIIYFKILNTYNLHEITDLHRKIWSQNLVPLLFVILPDEIRVYNGYKPPQRTVVNTLSEPLRVDTSIEPSEDVWERLSKFSKFALESGAFWRDYSYLFERDARVDQRLIANLRYIRHQMMNEAGLSAEHTHSLIGRSIFTFYLQDRDVLPIGEQGFFAQTFNKPYTFYTDILTSHEDTYAFFDFLRQRFNGDMFPVTREEKAAVKPEHLALLRKLFTVDSQSGGQMLFFWAYNFAFIPIELISSIYEEFLHQEESGKDGAYYTPPTLVGFMLNQVMPEDDSNYQLCLLDPACGSGIFLVEAYRRLIERWQKEKKDKEKITFTILSDILVKSIFGVDIKRQALRVAAFSLYLAMLDYLEPKNIWLDVVFPILIGNNLIETDFFNENMQLAGKRFDLVIGNPPWQSQLTVHAQSFLRSRKLVVGDRQIVQAFLWHAVDFCHPDGQIALLCSSKSLLFNQSGPNISFRYDFFHQFEVKAIFDFSALRRFLFEKGIAPATAIFYTSKPPNITATIIHGAPKLTYLTRLLSVTIIEAIDIKRIPVRQILENIAIAKDEFDIHSKNKNNQISVKQEILFHDNDDNDDDEYKEDVKSGFVNIWKVALWGTRHDYTLLDSLKNYPSLGEIIHSLGWDSGSGFIRSGPGEAKLCPWLDEAPFLDAKDLTRYGIDASKLKKLPVGAFYHRGRSPKRFQGPLVLFKRGQAQRRPCAAYLQQGCTYTNAITGISGTEPDLLKAITALLNSDLAQYYLFLTSSSWGVEREEIKPGEMRNLPVPFFDTSTEIIDKIASMVDRLAELTTNISSVKHGLWTTGEDKLHMLNEAEEELNKLIYRCFQLDEQDITLIQETVQQTIGFFNNPDSSSAQKIPPLEMQYSYIKAYQDVINFYLEPIGRKLIALIYSEDIEKTLYAPLLTIQFSSVELKENLPDFQIKHPTRQMIQVLSNLDRINNEPVSRKMFHRRNFRIYDRIQDSLFIIKPTEQRFWTISAALNDAQETIVELSQSIEANISFESLR